MLERTVDGHGEVGVARKDGREIAGDAEDARDDLQLEVLLRVSGCSSKLPLHLERRVARNDGTVLADGQAAVGEALDLDDLAGVAREQGVRLVVQDWRISTSCRQSTYASG